MLRRCFKQLIWNILNENVHWNHSKDLCSTVNTSLLLEFEACDEKEVVKLLTLTGIYRAILFCLLKLEACYLLSPIASIKFASFTSEMDRCLWALRACVCIVNIQVDLKTCIIFHVEEHCCLSAWVNNFIHPGKLNGFIFTCSVIPADDFIYFIPRWMNTSGT